VVCRRHSTGISKFITLLGSKLVRKVAVKKASSQNFRGIDAFARMERPTSII
jgi:hypothetical protein